MNPCPAEPALSIIKNTLDPDQQFLMESSDQDYHCFPLFLIIHAHYSTECCRLAG